MEEMKRFSAIPPPKWKDIGAFCDDTGKLHSSIMIQVDPGGPWYKGFESLGIAAHLLPAVREQKRILIEIHEQVAHLLEEIGFHGLREVAGEQ